MTDGATLEGACSCGRNEYIIIAPASFSQTVSVIYDERAEHARSLSLRVPLSHIRSSTYAFYPGETHAGIRRVFTPPHAPHTKRHFCGFCGDPLTHWSEQHRDDADWVYVNLGSLRRGSVDKLADQGLLPGSDASLESAMDQQDDTAIENTSPAEGREVRGAPWFENMIEGSQLGRIKRTRGGQSSADGRSKVSWEVVEYTSEPSETGNNTSKRKLSQVYNLTTEKSPDVQQPNYRPSLSSDLLNPRRRLRGKCCSIPEPATRPIIPSDIVMQIEGQLQKSSSNMGTLTDITSSAKNKQLRSVDSPLQSPKNAPSQSEGHVKGHFMSPTMASSKKANPSATKDESRNSTPTSIKIEKASTTKWMTSAARRVGLRRLGDGTPRSKKEGSKNSNNAVTFPDKLSTSSQSNMPDPPRPRLTPATSFSDKPLPSPPVAQVMNINLGEPRSLIDASEKPLQRTSPKSPSKQEDWPVLFPEKPTTPGSIRELLHQTTPEPVRLVLTERERYPRLSGSQSATSNLGQEPVARLPSTVQIQRKQLSSSSLRDNSLTDPAMDSLDQNIAHPTIRKTTKQSDLFPREPKNAHRLSAGAAAVEKSSVEAKSIIEPRQTRTSSLRARISAGQVIKDSPNKVLGFTDFTAEKAPSTRASKEDLSHPRPSASFGKVFTKKPSKEFLGGARAPAQFVAGSRHPIARRPSSRHSLRGDSRASSPTYMEPSRPPPPIPTAKNDTSTRKSSIPVIRNSVPFTAGQVESAQPPNDVSMSAQVPEVGKGDGNQFDIFEDKQNASATKDDSTRNLGNAVVLESIEESPRSTIRSKRISSGSPTFRPMLKISSSADRVIMGTGELNKENRPLVKKRSKDLFRAAVTNQHRNDARNKIINGDPKKNESRPLSSQGFGDRQRNDTVATLPRIDKVKSIDLGHFSTEHESKTELSTEHGDNASQSRKSSVTDDPFFDAVEQRKSEPEMDKDIERGAEIAGTSDGTEPKPSISPVKGSATPVSDAVPVVPAFLPETLQQHVHNSDGSSSIIRANEVKERKGEHSVDRVDTKMQRTTISTAPSAPDQKAGADFEKALNIFPLRSSSRTQQPDHTVNESAESSPISSLHQAATRLQNAISVTDFAKSGNVGTDSFSRPFHNGVVTPRRGLSVKKSDTILACKGDTQAFPGAVSQTTLADTGSKRHSTTRISHKSQSSVSKGGLMSNFRGLFHKRTSDASEVLNVRSNAKSSKRPTVNSQGSPFSSMSNVHPVYRPTQASLNRNNATGQRSSGNSLLSTAPGTPTLNSPLPTEISTTTSLAMQILDSARKESSSPKKERLISLGKIMVETITQAREAEKAMEEAKQAARKAEVAYALCKKSVGDVAYMVKEWRDDFEHL
ncbi:MAG: hypothetical protein Q9226_001909 [Calogaya cf. arnoldii]